MLKLNPARLARFFSEKSGVGVTGMALSRIIVRVSATWHRDEPAQAIYQANNLIAADATQGMFVTLFYGILDHDKKTVTCVNAGHNPPILYRAADGSRVEIEGTGM